MRSAPGTGTCNHACNSHTGVGGLTLGGGLARLARRFGLSMDNVRAYKLGTANGKFRHASPDENPDLYWGLRGGEGNFGVVTNIEFASRRVTGVLRPCKPEWNPLQERGERQY